MKNEENTGNQNTGNQNTGNLNTGDWNTGDLNTGDWNTGDWNTGNLNTGNWNTGDWNTGDWNTGHQNTGHQNTGDWNTGNWNTGFFCTETPKATFFDKPTDLSFSAANRLIPNVELVVGAEWVEAAKMSDEEKAKYPTFATTGGFLRKHDLTLQQAFALAWEKMSDEERVKWTSLPNFDAEKFLQTNGVDVRKTVAKPAESPVGKRVRIKFDSGIEITGTLIADCSFDDLAVPDKKGKS